MTHMCCPSCGRPLPRLPPIKRRIFDLVSRRPGISVDQLAGLVWADDPAGGPENARKNIHVQVNQLNHRLAPFGIAVRGSIAGGYRLVLQ
jgi:DNA-binding SARP family transcriptional activator